MYRLEICCSPGGPLIEKMTDVRAIICSGLMTNEFDIAPATKIASILEQDRFVLSMLIRNAHCSLVRQLISQPTAGSG